MNTTTDIHKYSSEYHMGSYTFGS